MSYLDLLMKMTDFSLMTSHLHLPALLSAMPTSQHPINNRCIEVSALHFYFIFDNTLHSCVYVTKHKKSCCYFCFILTLAKYIPYFAHKSKTTVLKTHKK